MHLTFTVLGSGSALPTVNRNPTAHLLNANERFFLLDCGEGTQIQLRKYKIRIQKIEKIFITHLHGDHYFGLIGLLNTFQLLGRNKPLDIIGPKGLEEIIKLQLKLSKSRLEYPYIFYEWDNSNHEVLWEEEDIKIERFPLLHRIPCCGYNFIIKQTKLKINTENILKYNIPQIELGNIQKGKDYTDEVGNIISNHLLTLSSQPEIKFSYCTDTAYQEDIIPYITNAKLLYHEATFIEKDLQRATETYHSTAKQAAKIALMAKVNQLVIGHFSARYKNTNLFLEEATGIFKNTLLAEEGNTYSA